MEKFNNEYLKEICRNIIGPYKKVFGRMDIMDKMLLLFQKL